MITIHAAVIHELKKSHHTRGPESVEVISRNGLHQHDPLLKQFVDRIDLDARTALRASSKCSIFTKDDTFGQVASNYFASNETYELDINNYLDLSIELVKALSVQMSKTSAATGGHIPILWYSRDDTEYLLIGLVNPSSGFTIDLNGVIVGNTNIDKEALRFSLRIELANLAQHHSFVTDPDANIQEADLLPYARWTKKSNDIAHYFQEYLPIDELLNNGELTRLYINLFDEYLKHIIPDDSPHEHKRVRFAIKQEVYRKMEERRGAEQPVRVEEDIVPIFNAMRESYPSVFESYEEITPYHQFCEDNDYENYDSIFNPQKASLDEVLNVSISIGDNLTIRGSKEGLAATTRVVVCFDADENQSYKLISDMTPDQYNKLKEKIPEIDTQLEDFTDDDIDTP
ncbi:nucleoid-associated protein [Psychrobacter sp. APC 3279]|uniref:nucleoid-associated protein n=1 Tax=Psychrobacter sp. APC 3279 TaxID=3035189 RepID=UPI0025B35331|nr:nucleoid-associated protein [Psychrobacter sp. APC 3279]MDN3442311.1 nucleoid-associated protein [Psychrobacter sp. APC 3279]